MKIGIVGAGNIGGTLVRKLRASGHQLRVANSRGPEFLSGLATETGATAVTAAEVAKMVVTTELLASWVIAGPGPGLTGPALVFPLVRGVFPGLSNTGAPTNSTPTQPLITIRTKAQA